MAITGASGAVYGIRALQILRAARVETHLVISAAAALTIPQETSWSVAQVLELADFTYSDSDTGARIASGSFSANGMLIAPCSIKTLSAVANSACDTLIARAADVCLKEGRPLLLAVRETPLHRGHLRLMDLAARSGAVIFPPVPAFYGHPQTLQDVIDASVGRMLARLGIENELYPRWTGL
ncbi:UbiX family flavin prenyltransferase [Ornatilinea apprima]|uniref:UbiX family flavin prenyltransferase n=1 Tax=Ornatilinea apprima TaxID=1134406 RepID=UPI002E7FD883|nr:UbiX family flavin prenyltransferase [Ornatilinea apprima]